VGPGCQKLISDILTIQDQRGEHVTAIDEVFRLYEDEKLPRSEMLEKSHSWLARESELGMEVAELYEQARAKGCL